MKKLLIPLTYIALTWGIFINLAVTLNLSFALPIAAGGKFTNFPAGIRIVYFLQMLWIVYELKIFNRLSVGKPVRPKWIINVFIVLSVLGFFMNIFSSSSSERWNAVGLGVTALAFFKLRP